MSIVAQKHFFPWDTKLLHQPLLWKKSKGLKHVTFHKLREIRWTGTGEVLTAVLNPLLGIRDPTQVSPKAEMGRIEDLTGSQTQQKQLFNCAFRQASEASPALQSWRVSHATSEAAFHSVHKSCTWKCRPSAVDIITTVLWDAKVTHTYSLQTQRKFSFLWQSLLSSII